MFVEARNRYRVLVRGIYLATTLYHRDSCEPHSNLAPVRCSIKDMLTLYSDCPDKSRSKFIHNAKRAFCTSHITIYASYTYARSSVAIGLPQINPDRSRSAEIDVE